MRYCNMYISISRILDTYVIFLWTPADGTIAVRVSNLSKHSYYLLFTNTTIMKFYLFTLYYLLFLYY